MKTIKAVTLFITVSLFSISSFAAGNLRVNVASKSESKATMDVSNSSNQMFEISLSNSSGEVLYRHKTIGDHSKFNKVFDFSKSEFGLYKLTVKLEDESNEQMVTVDENGVLVGESLKKRDPFFNFENNKLILSYVNLNNEEMNINIYNNGLLIWGQKMNNAPKVNKGFDLSELDPGNYSVVFSTSSEFYEYDLKKY